MKKLTPKRKTSANPVDGARAEEVALVCRVRLARNLEGERFPDWATEHDHARVFERVRSAFGAAAPDLALRPLSDFNVRYLEMLCEQNLISRDLLRRTSGGGIAFEPPSAVCVMVNEEDHLRIQGFADGFDLNRAWQRATRMDALLEPHLHYAWSPRLGYLTACPSNVGTGLRAGVMVHLLGLRLLGEIEAVMRGLERMRLLVRGIGGEGSEASGQIYQISNMDTLGVEEEAIVGRVTRIVAEVIRQALNARERLLRESPLLLTDCLVRALTVLQNARLMSAAEALELLSAVRLGAVLGRFSKLKPVMVNQLILLMQPGHMQSGLQADLNPDQRDEMRAAFLNQKLANVKWKG